MPRHYPIVEVQKEWTLAPEFMGTKDKFWYRSPSQNTDWLFKYPRPNSGEHWAEKIAAEVADLLGVLHAKVELATFEKYRGSASESFTRGERELTHGNQILAGAVQPTTQTPSAAQHCLHWQTSGWLWREGLKIKEQAKLQSVISQDT